MVRLEFECSVDTFASYGQLLNVPIAEDAEIFDQVELQGSTQGHGKQQGGTEQPKHSLEIIVDDPVKLVEQSMIPGMSGGYVTYRVYTKTTLPSFAKREISVRRRFREFVVGTSTPHSSFRTLFLLTSVCLSWRGADCERP